ncbi:MAG: TonB-dependent receptor plug domain-containing protein [Prevotellaceae bacterium]|nr:TonB-dependent receptor plug domain-containing protein [Prevotellaceae bacterium]
MNKKNTTGVSCVALALIFGANAATSVNAAETDSTRVDSLHEVMVQGVRVSPNAPFAVSRINGREMQSFARTGQELPFLFARTPGVVAWSENGLGTGTTYMRMRGSAGSRINVTLDGVALNSPEDQTVFWANMNSYAALMGSAQIQRGVGSSTNGDGAFGGTVALQTKSPRLQPSGQLSLSYGSYDTYNLGGDFSTGLIGNNVVLEGSMRHTGTDGYIHGTGGNSGSYFGGITFMNNARSFKLSYKNIGNYEMTGQAWNGVTAGNGDYSLNAYDGIRTYKDMYERGLGRFNSLYERFALDYDNWAPVKDANGNYTATRYQMSDGTPWPKATDNFWQNHSLLNASWAINPYWSATATLHYTYGHGYYKEFRPDNKASKFGLPYVDGKGKSQRTDFVRQKGLTQHTYGVVASVNYKRDRWDVVGGLNLQNFDANHYGYLTYVADEAIRKAVLKNGKYKYYDSDADKNDYSIFLKGTYHITPRLDAFADVQYRRVSFRTDGINDRFLANADGTYSNQPLNIDEKYGFVNPKAGLSYHVGGHKAYVSYALAHREPERNNFTDNYNYPAPKAESLHDFELGYSYNHRRWFAGIGAYAMLYHNQFVQTGEQSEIGEALTTNIRRSQRLGVELQGGVSLTQWLSLEGNAALSLNQIKDFDEVVETYDGDWRWKPSTTVHYDNSTLAFSPSAIVNGFVDFHHKGFRATWHTNFVSRQYLDNTENKQRSLPKYSQSNLHMSYELRVDRHLKSVVFGLNLNNLFNARYAAGGWVYSAIVGDSYPEQNRYYQMGYVPMAGFTAMGSVAVKF